MKLKYKGNCKLPKETEKGVYRLLKVMTIKEFQTIEIKFNDNEGGELYYGGTCARFHNINVLNDLLINLYSFQLTKLLARDRGVFNFQIYIRILLEEMQIPVEQ
jgi:hypothetical protein